MNVNTSKANGDGKGQGKGVEVLTSGELMARLGRKAEGVNLLEIEKYLRESKVRAPVRRFGCGAERVGHDVGTSLRSRGRSLGTR